MTTRKFSAPAQNTRRNIEQRMRELLRDLRERQHEQRAMNGKYWQGAKTHIGTPVEGTPEAADGHTRKPSDQDENWTQFGVTLPAGLECSLQVDVYSGPLGDGYTVTAEVEVDGELWRRVANVGPETHRSREWAPISVPL